MRAHLACLRVSTRVGLGPESQRTHIAIWTCDLENRGWRQNRGKPSWGHRRRANTSAKLPSFVCVEEDPDRGSENAGAAGTRLRRAPGHVLPYRIGVGDQQ